MRLPERRRTWGRRGVMLLLVVVPLAGAGMPRTALGGGSRRSAIVAATQRAQPSVVSISSEKKAASSSRWPFSAEESQRPRVNGMGTGVIIDERGYILTNHHVVDKVQGIEVHLTDGTVFGARVLQYDPQMDLAILKVDAGHSLPAIAIGTSADLMIGESVITIGNAFGYENTVSTGIISALKRNVTLADDQVYRNLIQTDACINPGNSGGPLINIDGELIGINVAVRAGAQGIGFALPIDDVKRSAAEMLSTRRLAATWHGLVAVERSDGDARAVVVHDIPAGSPAEVAGLKQGDRILSVGEWTVTNPIDIERGLLDAVPGKPTPIKIRRGGHEKALALDVKPVSQATADAEELVWRVLGLKTLPVSAEYVSAASPQLRGGLYVQGVSPGSPCAIANIQKGDILVGLNAGQHNWETIRPDNVLFILRRPEVAQAQSVRFYIVRRNTLHNGTLSLAEIQPSETLSR